MENTRMTLVGKRILVVDDDVTLATMLQKLLATFEDFETIIAYNGLQALETLAKQPVDLIFLDIMMPGKNGYDTLKELKANPATKNIPVILLTSLAEIDNIDRGINLGASDYLIKSNANAQKIRDLVDKYLISLNAREHSAK